MCEQFLARRLKFIIYGTVGDAEAFAEAMCKIADSEDFAQELGKNAKLTRQTHAAETIIKAYFDFFKTVAK